MFGILAGKKTYITASLGILGAIGGFLSGEMQIPEVVNIIVTSILAMTIRNGIANQVKK